MPSPNRLPLVTLAVLTGALVCTAPAVPAPASAGPQQHITAAGMLQDIAALSADSMGGRAPGTAGDRMARAYLARRLEAIGFAPGGPDGSWEQAFPIVGLSLPGIGPWRFDGPAGEAVFQWREDYVGGSGVQAPHVAIEDAEVVFVGYGIRAPEFQWDDFKDADLRGKVLLVLNNDPDWDSTLFAGRKRLYYGRWDYKYEEAARQGAVAAIVVHTTPSAGYGWNVVARSWSGTLWDVAAGDEARLRFKSWLTEAAARRLCALGGRELDSLVSAAHRRDFVPVPLGVRTSFAFDVKVEQGETANVIGVLPGSDPALSREAVLFTAHHDHLGIGAPDSTGDRVHHGAVDNASGCAQVLALAEAFAATKPRPRRSIVALFTAGEEQNLLGARYYAAHPTFALGRIAADVNFDGANVWGRTADVAVIGKGKSDLEDRLAAAARDQGRRLVDDPEPDKGYYYRADQLSFARAGIPSLYFDSGRDYIGRPAGWGDAKSAEFLRLRYHQPGDRILPGWDLSGAVEDTQLGYVVGLGVANAGQLPAWYAGDEFEAARKRALEEAKSGGGGH
jgi:Zn-dependent M28 family amino/carboxypeptidase